MGLVRRSLLGVLVVVLAAPVAVAVDLVTASDVLTTDTTLPQDGGGGGGAAQGASEAETTDTTLSGSSGDAAGSGSGGVRGASHCSGRGHRIDGTCRACAALDEYHDGTSCVKKTKPAPKDPTCPAGQTYFSSYGGCRPSSCSYGRTSTGWCRSRPSCPSGQSYLAEYGGCRPTTCNPDNGRSSTGWCRACKNPTHYHNGTGCVPKVTAAPNDPPRTEPNHLYYGYWKGCRPKMCTPDEVRTAEGWCETETTETTPVVTLPVPPSTAGTTTTTVRQGLPGPTGVKADGSVSPAATGRSPIAVGTSDIEWDMVEHATGYEVRYIKWESRYANPRSVPQPDDDDWTVKPGRGLPRIKKTQTKYRIQPLDIEEPYIVQVRAFFLNGVSEWSDRIYTYSTNQNTAIYRSLMIYWQLILYGIPSKIRTEYIIITYVPIL